jgi:hypothetical protein
MEKVPMTSAGYTMLQDELKDTYHVSSVRASSMPLQRHARMATCRKTPNTMRQRKPRA